MNYDSKSLDELTAVKPKAHKSIPEVLEGFHGLSNRALMKLAGDLKENVADMAAEIINAAGELNTPEKRNNFIENIQSAYDEVRVSIDRINAELRETRYDEEFDPEEYTLPTLEEITVDDLKDQKKVTAMCNDAGKFVDNFIRQSADYIRNRFDAYDKKIDDLMQDLK